MGPGLYRQEVEESSNYWAAGPATVKRKHKRLGFRGWHVMEGAQKGG